MTKEILGSILGQSPLGSAASQHVLPSLPGRALGCVWEGVGAARALLGR